MITNTNIKPNIPQKNQFSPGFKGNSNTVSNDKSRPGTKKLSENSFIINLKKLKKVLYPTKNNFKSYNLLKQVLENNFANNLKTITKDANESAKYVKDQLIIEYGFY